MGPLLVAAYDLAVDEVVGLKRRDFIKLAGLVLGTRGGSVVATASAAPVVPEAPAAGPVFLIATHIAGTTYVQGIDRLAASIGAGERLELLREPANPFDDLAILVRTRAGVKMGYVPRKDNAVLARLLDAEKPIHAIVDRKQQIRTWHKIDISIYLME